MTDSVESPRLNHANESFSRFLRHYILVILVIFAGIILTIGLVGFQYQWQQTNKNIALERDAQKYAHAIESKLDSYLEALSFFGYFVEQTPHMSRQQFARYAQTVIPRYPGIHAFSWDPVVSDQLRAKYEQEAKSDGLVNFEFIEYNPQGQVIKAPQQASYTVIYFVEPLRSNELALGFNINSKPARHKALTQAFKHQQLTATPAIPLAQGQKNDTGVLFLLPIYQAEATTSISPAKTPRGLVVEVLKLDYFFENAIAHLAPSGLDIYLYDNVDHEQPTLLYYHPSRLADDATTSTTQSPPPFNLVTFTVANRQWQLQFYPSANYPGGPSVILMILTMLLGFALTTALAVILFNRIHYTNKLDLTNKRLQQEIIEREYAQVQNQVTTKYLDTVIENLPVGVAIFAGKDFSYRKVNQAFANLTGLDVNKHQGKTCAQTLPADFKEKILPELNRVFERGKATVQREFSVLSPGQIKHNTYFVDWHLPIKDVNNHTEAIVTVLFDVSEIKHSQQQRRQASKLEALGTMAGGIAHDFNNILAAVLGNIEISLMVLEQSNPARQYLTSIGESAQRATNLVRQILIFSRMDAIDLKPLELSQHIRSSLKTVRQDIPNNIIIEQQLPQTSPRVLSDSHQIEQIMLNLLSNAIDAMRQNGGTIKVILKALSLQAPSESLGLQPGKYVRLVIKDNGQGISTEHLERVFDPFFTTKEVGQGTGLGLSVVHGIIEKHNAKITLKSELSVGTTVTLYFPACNDRMLKSQTYATLATSVNRHILLVEDEFTLVKLYQQFLQKKGYKVTVANNGEEALAHFSANPQQFDLVITDQAMPKMTGKRLVKALFAIRPDVPVILSTGYSDVLTDTEAKQMGIKKYLVKPIKLTVLQQSIEECFE